MDGQVQGSLNFPRCTGNMVLDLLIGVPLTIGSDKIDAP
jgi:hypothetical protein